MYKPFFQSNDDHLSLKEFDEMFGDGKKIDKFTQGCVDEIQNFENYKLDDFQFSINTKQNINEETRDKKKGEKKLDSIKEIEFRNLQKLTKTISKIKAAQLNQQIFNQCKGGFQEKNPQESKSTVRQSNDQFVTKYLNELNIDIDNSLELFYQELFELKEIAKVEIQNLADSIAHDSLVKFSQK